MSQPSPCSWPSLEEALTHFAAFDEKTQSQKHIRPLHDYVACRLVIEGGFFPDEITPRPPFAVTRKGKGLILEHKPDLGGTGEATILGGLKTKDVDVVVEKKGVGPVIAVSMKGTLNAFRNLTNRMEEAVGDCTNLHISYPALVYGFLHVMRATKAGLVVAGSPAFLKPDSEGRVKSGDTAVKEDGNPTEFILRYHQALARLADRNDIRDNITKYEAVALLMVDPAFVVGDAELVLPGYPESTSPLHPEKFFPRIYHEYDLRFVYQAPQISNRTRRVAWDPDSPVLTDPRLSEYAGRCHD